MGERTVRSLYIYCESTQLKHSTVRSQSITCVQYEELRQDPADCYQGLRLQGTVLNAGSPQRKATPSGLLLWCSCISSIPLYSFLS